MAESTLSLGYADFANAVSSEYGSGPDYTAITDTSEAAMVDRLVQEGYQLALYPPVLPNDTQRHIWSWLRQIRHLTTVAPYSTGTITIAAGALTTVNLAGVGAVFPSWAADAQIVIQGRPYRVSVRNGNTQLTLTENGPEVAAAAYSLQRYYYTMEDDFGGIEGPITFQTGWSSRPIRVVGEGRIREEEQLIALTGRPQCAAIHWDATQQGATKSMRARIQFTPIPDQAYYLGYRCKILPNKLDATTLVYPLGGMEFCQTIMAACLACTEKKMLRQQGPRWGEFMLSLQAAIYSDRQNAPEHYAPDSGQYLMDSSGAAWPYTPHLVVYQGGLP